MHGSATDSISACYQSYAAELHRFAFAKVRDATAAEDIVHEAFLRLAIETRSGRFPRQPRAWLYRVTLNLIVSQARRAGTAARHVAAQPAMVVVDETPESRCLAVERSRYLAAAMHVAGPRGRRGLIMAAEGYSGREIARTLGRNEGATRTLMCRARSAVRRQLAIQDGPEFRGADLASAAGGAGAR